ncbi:hypothetical protein M728_004085 (plasmid) [Ensifer sp. WSM1721]|uniref:hypothetical protein n=1 Tax=Ensifer sp. WSM1721 TaxID=1041159 RepID=UPI0004BB9BDA|nr:hypothetical protein [Ensifer sp. WSM1721]
MRLVFLHGINQQGKSSEIIRREWTGFLGDPGELASIEIVAPFYGDVLAGATEPATPEQAVAMGIPGDDEEREFVTSALHQVALERGLTRELIEREQAITQGPLEDRRFLAILRLLEKLSPFKGGLFLLLVRQAYAYLRRDHVTLRVDGVVRPCLTDGCVVVGHSLGSVIGFRLLRELKVKVPLFTTLGSPLALEAVKSALRRPHAVPAGVTRWYNGLDVDDLVTLGKPLTQETFAGGIFNNSSIENGEDAHAIEGYLGDADVRSEIFSAVTP